MKLIVQVLRNKGVSKEVRRARAQGLHELGGIFLDAAASYVEAAPAQDQVPFHLLPVSHPHRSLSHSVGKTAVSMQVSWTKPCTAALRTCIKREYSRAA